MKNSPLLKQIDVTQTRQWNGLTDEILNNIIKQNKMENKFYTPDISEFHVGFEYERFINDEDYWDKLVMSVNFLTLGEIDEEINKQEIRVKYLDKEDIESLGFVEYEENCYELKKEDCILNFTKSGFIVIYLYYANSTLFQGYCKNKSELKKLMKQLDIKQHGN